MSRCGNGRCQLGRAPRPPLSPENKTLMPQHPIHSAIAFLIPLILGIHLIFDPGHIPGGLGDPRLNMWVLEHGYQWLTGKVDSFWHAPFFFPAPDTLTYSVNHIGSL